MKKGEVVDFSSIRSIHYAALKEHSGKVLDIAVQAVTGAIKRKKQAFEALFDALPEMQKSAGIPDITFRASDNFTEALLAGADPCVPILHDRYAFLEGKGKDGKDYVLMVSMFPEDDEAVFRPFFCRFNADDKDDQGEVLEGDEWVAI